MDKLGSRALRTDAVESITCRWLSLVAVVSLAAQAVLGFWWIDSVRGRQNRENESGQGKLLATPIPEIPARRKHYVRREREQQNAANPTRKPFDSLRRMPVPCRSSVDSRDIRTPAEIISITLSNPNATSTRLPRQCQQAAPRRLRLSSIRSSAIQDGMPLE
jgi:hypothetical protein